MSDEVVLVTGATGFVGRVLLQRLCSDGRCRVVAPVRDPGVVLPDGVRRFPVSGDLHQIDWRPMLDGVTAVVHLAARVHRMRDDAVDIERAYREDNVEASLALASQAAAAGAKRLVFVSSAKVHGESAGPGRPFRPEDPAAPEDPYARSKATAEAELRLLAGRSGMELVIVRPPLVYGPGVRANFQALMKVLCRGVPLPLAGIDNRRSLVAVDNLVDALTRCLWHPAAAGQSFLVSDGEDLSTPELLRRLGAALGHPARLWRLPAGWLDVLARLAGRSAAAARLTGSLCLDSSALRQRLGWTPPVTVDEALLRTARAYLRP